MLPRQELRGRGRVPDLRDGWEGTENRKVFAAPPSCYQVKRGNGRIRCEMPTVGSAVRGPIMDGPDFPAGHKWIPAAFRDIADEEKSGCVADLRRYLERMVPRACE